MQAGDSLDRIQGGERARPMDDFLVIKKDFEALCDDLLLTHMPYVRSFFGGEIIPETDTVELLLHVDHEDGSYLYIMIEATPRRDSDKQSVPSMTIVEYTAEEKPLREHVYWADKNIIRRRDGHDFAAREIHPSPVNILRKMQQIEDNSSEGENAILDLIFDQFKDLNHSIGADSHYEFELDMGDQPVPRDEIAQLRELVSCASPWMSLPE